MSQINDLIYSQLGAQGYTGALPDRLLAWWRELNDNSTTGNINDNAYSYLSGQYPTAPQSLPDLLFWWMEDLGYSGAFSDMWYDFWSDGGIIEESLFLRTTSVAEPAYRTVEGGDGRTLESSSATDNANVWDESNLSTSANVSFAWDGMTLNETIGSFVGIFTLTGGSAFNSKRFVVRMKSDETSGSISLTPGTGTNTISFTSGGGWSEISFDGQAGSTALTALTLTSTGPGEVNVEIYTTSL